MLPYLLDECVHGSLLDGLLQRQADLDIVRVQDVGLASTHDQSILVWAADEGRVVITNDRSTLIGFAYERVMAGEPLSTLTDHHLLSIGLAAQVVVAIAVATALCWLDRAAAGLARLFARSTPTSMDAPTVAASGIPIRGRMLRPPSRT